MLQSLALAILALTGLITVTQIIVLQLIQGVINSFDTPARQAFVVEMVEDRADLSNAIALNSSMVNGSRIIGPSIAGVLIAAVGEGWCFMIDAISYVAVIASLLAMRLIRTDRPKSTKRVLEELVDGLRYVSGFLPIRWMLFLLALVATMGMPYTVLMPAVAANVLHGGANTLGFLMTATGVGALLGALYLASRRTVFGLELVIVAAALTFGVGLIGFALSRNLILSMVILAVAGAGFMIMMASTNTLIQTIVDENMRGRVMSFYAMAFLGTSPLGSLASGVVADWVGVMHTIMLGGIACCLGALAFAFKLQRLRTLIQPIFEAKGVVTGMAVQKPASAVHP
jgi:MFS family permease